VKNAGKTGDSPIITERWDDENEEILDDVSEKKKKKKKKKKTKMVFEWNKEKTQSSNWPKKERGRTEKRKPGKERGCL